MLCLAARRPRGLRAAGHSVQSPQGGA